MYLDKIKKFQGNEYTAFGTALHYVCENLVVDHSKVDIGKSLFQDKFVEELQKTKKSGYQFNEKLLREMKTQGDNIIEFILPQLNNHFMDYRVVSVEEPIYEPINHFDTDYDFKGFIDLVLKTPDGKYHIIDWKTCSWGWDMKKRSDKLITYQLTLYKKFFCEKHSIDPSLVETHFALLKRTAKKDNVEIFRVTSGDKKTKNATKLLSDAIINIEKQNFVKNRTSCTYCEFDNTEFCTR